MHTTYSHYSSTLVVVRMHRYESGSCWYYMHTVHTVQRPHFTPEQGLEIRNASGTLDLSNRQDFCE